MVSTRCCSASSTGSGAEATAASSACVAAISVRSASRLGAFLVVAILAPPIAGQPTPLAGAFGDPLLALPAGLGLIAQRRQAVDLGGRCGALGLVRCPVGRIDVGVIGFPRFFGDPELLLAFALVADQIAEAEHLAPGRRRLRLEAL